uniref:Pot.ORF B n=1 Tax=Saccharomyces cerevisiae TaxID=4932 RepID=E9PA21_YEASX|nr:unnamed protein product [Saccharomyces cerevisiae]
MESEMTKLPIFNSSWYSDVLVLFFLGSVDSLQLMFLTLT